jgi:hypothetical protein
MAAVHYRLGENCPSDWRNGLASAYVNRGNAKQSAPGFGPGAAIADYDAAIALMEALRDGLGEGWPVPWRNDLASAYTNRGVAKQSAPGFGPAAAIADYDAAIALREALRDGLGEGWPVPWRNDLANAYMNRGTAKQSAPGFGPGAAIADYDAAIALMEALRDGLGEGWPVPWRNDLANAYMNRGTAKQDAPGFGPGAAIADYDAAIAVMEALRNGLGEGWPVPWRNELAAAYMNRGVAKQSAPGFGPSAAIADYDTAIALREALRDGLGEGWPVPWRNDLANAYMNRGNAKVSAPGFGPGAAIADYDAAIVTLQPLLVFGKTFFAPAAEIFLLTTKAFLDIARRRHLLDRATDLGDDALLVARNAERLGVTWYRRLREQVFEATLSIYRQSGALLSLPQIIAEDLDPAVPGSAADSLAMTLSAMTALAGAQADLLAKPRTPQTEEVLERLVQSQTWLSALAIRRYAGTAMVARINAAAEAAAGRPVEAERILTRQVTYRPLDPEGFLARAAFFDDAKRRAEAERDQVHAARLSRTLHAAITDKTVEQVGQILGDTLRLRLADIAETPAFGDPSQGPAMRRAFDALHRWFTTELIEEILEPLPDVPGNTLPAEHWRGPLQRVTQSGWEAAFLLREKLQSAQTAAAMAQLSEEMTTEFRSRREETFRLTGLVVPRPFVDFMRAVASAIDEAREATKTLAEPERSEEAGQRVSEAVAAATQRLSDAALEAPEQRAAAALGASWSALKVEERRFLATAQLCAETQGVTDLAVIELACAVEWSLLHRLMVQVRAGLGEARQAFPPPTVSRNDWRWRLHDYFTAATPKHPADPPLMFLPLLKALDEAIKTGSAAPGNDPVGALAAWLYRQPNTLLHAGRARDRHTALYALNQARNKVAHPPDEGAAPPDVPAHWRAVIADPVDAFFRYFPAIFG